MKNQTQNKIIVILTILLLLALTAAAELGTPLEAIRRDINVHTITYAADTTIVEYNSRQGHLFGVRLDSRPAKWYFVKGVAVKIEAELSRRELRIQRRHLSRNWIDRGENWQLGNRMARIEGRLITVWYGA